MADNQAPVLKRLVLPATIDLANGPAQFEALIEALDDEAGSGINYVSVWFDRNIWLDGRSTQILQLGAYSDDNFSDATPAVAKSQFTFDKANAGGVYNITSVWVTDRGGNTTQYDAQQLGALGIQTTLSVTGSAPDIHGPTLTRLALPDVVDVSSGSAPMQVSVEASDNPGGTGIYHVALEFDKPLVRADGTGQFMSLGFGPDDRFDDATPTTAIDIATLSNMTSPGTYSLRSLTLHDHAGNQSKYDAAQLQAMGIDTTMEVKGGVVDTTGPKLHGLWLPQNIALDAEPRQVASAVAEDGPGGTGVASVSVVFDRPIDFKAFPSQVVVIGVPDSKDSFKDQTAVFATGGFTLADSAKPGTYRVTGVLVQDLAGNSTHYSGDELMRLGMNTSMTIVAGKPTASVATSASGSQVQLALTSGDWAAVGSDKVSLKLRYDPAQADFAGLALVGASSNPLSATVTEVGNIGFVTITGSVPLEPDARLLVKMNTFGPGSAFGYTVDSFIVNDKAQLFAQERSGNVLLGTAGADRIAGADRASYIDGHDGVDVALFPGMHEDYRITKSAAGFVVDNFIDAPVTLVDVERLEFADKSYALDIGGAGGQVYRLYQAAFDRKPDESGVGYWLGQMDRGASLAQVAEQFLQSAEFDLLYGVGPSDEAFVAALYDNVLHRAPDQAGFDYWVNTVKATGDRIGMLVQFSESGENVAQVVGSIGNGFAYYP